MAVRLTLEDVTYSYPLTGKGEESALAGVSFDVEPGEVLCVAGANGSGKSTLAQVCAGLLAPTSGSLRYGGTRVSGRNGLRRFRAKAGLLFQNPECQLFADTVEKDIAFGPHNLGLRGDELAERVRRSAAVVGLHMDELGKRSPFALSEGQKRRVALAGVLAREPEVLVLDEPFIGLDFEGAVCLREALEEYRTARRATVIVVTHELSHVWSLATSFALMAGGRLVRLENRENLLRGDTDLAGLGMQLPQWGTIARELLRGGIPVGDPSDLRALAMAVSRGKGAPGGR